MSKKLLAILLTLCICLSVVGCSGSSTTADYDTDSGFGYGSTDSCNHNFEPATCEEPETCSLCGEQNGQALGHSYGDWKTTEKSTCKDFGTKERVCSVCGDSEKESIEKLAHTWKDATCSSAKKCKVCGITEGEPSTHDYPNLDFKCKTCGGKVYASDYKYLAAHDFRSIRLDYGTAVATHADTILYTDGYGSVCLLVEVYYTIGSKRFSDMILHNFTENQRIEDPTDYYDYLSDYYFGATALKYMNLHTTVLEMRLKMLNGEGYTVSADYLNM